MLAPGNHADTAITLPSTPGLYVVNDIFIGSAHVDEPFFRDALLLTMLDVVEIGLAQ